jgi:Dna[CI] antecedent, DciA
MPNNPTRDKHKYRTKSKPLHVAAVVQRVLPARVTQTGSVSEEWRELLRAALDPELAPHIVNVLSKPRELVVFTESAAWCSRLKLALGQIGAIARARDPGIAKVQVRIMPAGSAR